MMAVGVVRLDDTSGRLSGLLEYYLQRSWCEDESRASRFLARGQARVRRISMQPEE